MKVMAVGDHFGCDSGGGGVGDDYYDDDEELRLRKELRSDTADDTWFLDTNGI